MDSPKKTFTIEEVAKHGKASDCWIVIHGKVYEVTTFLTEHPGGEEIILGCTGRDADTTADTDQESSRTIRAGQGMRRSSRVTMTANKYPATEFIT